MALEVQIEKKMADVSLKIELRCARGELVALVGPSGAGKSSILRCIAGLERPDRGRISCHGETWYDSAAKFSLPPQKRGLGFIFQEYPLFPHLNVLENVCFANRDRHKAKEILETLGIVGLAQRQISRLSGGERQRVALAQILAREPRLLLLDEPFSALDSVTAGHLRKTLLTIKENRNLPILQVTHHPKDVKILADRLVPINNGRVTNHWLEDFFAGCTRRSSLEMNIAKVASGL